jgi:hypothetical protein
MPVREYRRRWKNLSEARDNRGMVAVYCSSAALDFDRAFGQKDRQNISRLQDIITRGTPAQVQIFAPRQSHIHGQEAEDSRGANHRLGKVPLFMRFSSCPPLVKYAGR